MTAVDHLVRRWLELVSAPRLLQGKFHHVNTADAVRASAQEFPASVQMCGIPSLTSVRAIGGARSLEGRRKMHAWLQKWSDWGVREGLAFVPAVTRPVVV